MKEKPFLIFQFNMQSLWDVWKIDGAAWHSKIGSTNGVSLGQDWLCLANDRQVEFSKCLQLLFGATSDAKHTSVKI